MGYKWEGCMFGVSVGSGSVLHGFRSWGPLKGFGVFSQIIVFLRWNLKMKLPGYKGNS